MDLALLDGSEESMESTEGNIDECEEGVTLLSTPVLHLQNDPSSRKNGRLFKGLGSYNRRLVIISSFCLVSIALLWVVYYQISSYGELVTSVGEPVVVIGKGGISEIGTILEPQLTTPIDQSIPIVDPIFRNPIPPLDVKPPPFSYYPSSTYFDEGGPFGNNPSPYTNENSQGATGSAEASVNKAYGNRSSRRGSGSRNTRQEKKRNDSPRFEIRKQGTRAIPSGKN